ncbi:MAG: hypothetical protein ACLR5S_10815 [Ruminococcus sp.]
MGFYAAIALCLWLQDHLLHLDILHLAVPTSTTCVFGLLAILAVLTEQILPNGVRRKKLPVQPLSKLTNQNTV